MRIGSAPRRRCIKAIGVGGVAATAENIFPPNEGRVLSSSVRVRRPCCVCDCDQEEGGSPSGRCVCCGLEIRSFTWQEDFSRLVDSNHFVQAASFVSYMG